MNVHRRQRGQALVAALVTVALLFALAGGLAVALSAALAGPGSTTGPYLRDAQAASATAAIIATVAGGPTSCPSAATVSAAFGLSSTEYSCDRMDLVAPGQAAMVPFQWTGTCASAPLPATVHASLWLHAIRVLGSFFVDGNKDGCSAGAGPCTAGSTNGGPGHFYSIGDCNLAAFGTPYAHVAGPAGAVSVVRLAPLASFVPGPGSPWAVDQGVGPIATAALRGPGQPLDLVVGSKTTGTVAVWLGANDGTVHLRQTITTPGDISSLVLADFNGDGWPDLAFTSSQRSLLSVWLGNGDGTFSKSRDYSVGAGPVGVVAGPLISPDGVDLATANSVDHSVSILRPIGGGTFVNSSPPCDVQNPPTALAVINTPSSGTYLAVAKAAGLLTVYSVIGGSDHDSGGSCTTNGTGFASLHETHTPYTLAGGPGALAVGHFTNSGQPDLSVALPNQKQVQVLLGSGNGLFQVQPAFGVGDSPSALAAGNFGYGAAHDLAVTKASGVVSALIGNGDGTFRPVLGGDLTVGQQPAGIATGDFDGSGGDSLAIATSGDGRLSVLLRNRSRVFSILASAPGGSAFDEADLIWANPTHTNTLFFEGGLQ